MKSVMALVLAGSSFAVAQEAVQWRVEDGGNGHWYQMRVEEVAISQHRTAADAVGAHFVTITSAEEGVFVDQLRDANANIAFITGGYQDATAPDYSEPAGGWLWETGEPMDYMGWGIDYEGIQTPANDSLGTDAEILGIRWQDDTVWTDVDETIEWGAMLEWSSDCNNDGIVDYGQIRDGSTRDLNANGVPDNCEATEWTLEAGGNGHFYQLIFTESSGNPVVLSGTEIQELVPDGAYLATLTSPQENDFVSFTIADDIRAWLPINGGDSNDRTAGPFIGLIGQGECDYGWVSGEPLEYTYWHPGNPGECDFALCQLWEYEGERRWQDHTLGVEAGNSFVLEWSDDCNDDGIVDISQIISGTFVDSDSNGIPDQCEFGACCIDGNCLVALASSCAASGGQFSGAGSTCNSTVCEPSVDDCPGDITDDGQVDFTDLLIIVSTWGPCSDG